MSKRILRDAPKARMKTISVADMVINLVKEEKRSERKPSSKSRSITPSAMCQFESKMESEGEKAEEVIAKEEFFDEPVGTSYFTLLNYKSKLTPAQNILRPKKQKYERLNEDGGKRDTGFQVSRKRISEVSRRAKARTIVAEDDDDDDDDDDDLADKISDFFTNSDRKQDGLGCVGKILGVKGPAPQQNWRPCRPFFTVWITLMQVVIFIAVCAIYGIAPINIGKIEISEEIFMTSLVKEKVAYKMETNIWIGPTAETLIHIGAKYSPCMRKDKNVEDLLVVYKEEENRTACCIRNDGSGCFQSLENDCSSTLATWEYWSETSPGKSGQKIGSVCGIDPLICENPSKNDEQAWSTSSITDWPLCQEKMASDLIQPTVYGYSQACEIVGRPCCIGIKGECVIATREYCEFRKGYFHENANLCSQVSCLSDVCGMSKFVHPDKPDHFYRLITSQFLHAGLMTLLITLLLQIYIMAELEYILGWWRMTLIYLLSGIAGSLGSAVFLPYNVEAGPSGSQFGIIAALYVEVLRWNQYSSPYKTIGKLTFVLLIMFILGLIPTIDNWAHLLGFMFGLPLCIGFKPYKTLCKRELSKVQRIIFAIGNLSLAAAVFGVIVGFFYYYPIYECSYCSYFTCVPVTADFCDNMAVSLARTDL